MSIPAMKTFLCLLSLLALSLLCTAARAADAIPPIARVLPPEGLEIPADVRTRLEARLATTKKRLEAVNNADLKPDIEIYTKAVDYALRHREFYVANDFAKADWALDEANQRLEALAKGESPWTKAKGLVVEGYRSSIDGSAQPYCLVIPEGLDVSKPCPLYVWLHGRGNNSTDIHFIKERATRPGQITPPNAIVVHPFGRQCVGWKHAGEIDVLEVVDSVKKRYKIDPDRIVLIGFSMGGAGAWHIGAHYTDHWVAVSPGAGFVDTRRYQNITPDKYPADYVQKLWSLYDVPDYVRNLFNTNVIAYSGELDPQRKAAVLMEDAFKAEGRTLTHLIGPGVEHKYEPETLKELLKRLDAVVTKGRDKSPKEVHLETRTLRYGHMHWVNVFGLEKHWEEARIDAEIVSPNKIKATTKNVSAVQFWPQGDQIETVSIDGQEVPIKSIEGGVLTGASLFKVDNVWRHEPARELPHFAKAKAPRHQGPIDDAFFKTFVVIVPTGKSKNAAFQTWVDFELNHFRNRWRALMRGELPEIRDTDFKLSTVDGRQNLVLWGDADSNSAIKQLADQLPVKYSAANWSFSGQSFDGNRFVPSLVVAPPLGMYARARNYIVLNSGLTFREGHDGTNSQQNPKLPDWAIIDISQPPNAELPGRIHDAGFFDEQWQLKAPPKAP
jgi:predicted esterase